MLAFWNLRTVSVARPVGKVRGIANSVPSSATTEVARIGRSYATKPVSLLKRASHADGPTRDVTSGVRVICKRSANTVGR
jgi:hypothetical protein